MRRNSKRGSRGVNLLRSIDVLGVTFFLDRKQKLMPINKSQLQTVRERLIEHNKTSPNDKEIEVVESNKVADTIQKSSDNLAEIKNNPKKDDLDLIDTAEQDSFLCENSEFDICFEDNIFF